MVLTINDTDYEVRFGVAFVRQLDETYAPKDGAGRALHLGLETVMPYVLAKDVTALSDILYEGMILEKKRPAKKDIDNYIDTIEDFDAFHDEVMSELKKQNATRTRVTEIEEAIKKEDQKAKS